MNDPWKFFAFPVASVVGYLASLALTDPVASATALKQLPARLAVIAGMGFFAGFLVDELIPAYIHDKSGGGGGELGGDMDFDGGGDFDLDS